MIRRIRDLLYDQGFTISGARNKLLDTHQSNLIEPIALKAMLVEIDDIEINDLKAVDGTENMSCDMAGVTFDGILFFRRELFEIRELLSLTY